NTSIAPMNPVPVTTTVSPPEGGPAAGATPVTVGSTANTYSSPGPVELVPPGVVTVISTVPAPCGGKSSTVICVALVTLKQGLFGEPEHGVVVISVASTVTSVVLKFAPGPKLDANPVPVSMTVLP